MFRDREEMRRRLHEIIEKFRQKGATSPEKAVTIQELGLPPRFEEAMHRRLGQSGIFVEINGKYYLNEERLKQIQEQRAKVGSTLMDEKVIKKGEIMEDAEVLWLLKQHPGLKTRTMTRMLGLPPRGLYIRVLARLIKRGLVRIEHSTGRYQGARYYAT